MVDVSTYRTVHSDSIEIALDSMVPKRAPIKLSAKAMESDDPPEGEFIYLLPPSIYGFNMVEKKWRKRHLKSQHYGELH